MIAALYVQSGGGYFGLPGVDPWDEARDAKAYAGPWPVIAHPPCERWARFWHGSPRKPHQFKLGDDKGCFKAAFASVNEWGGVIEHPEATHAWRVFGIPKPPKNGGWIPAGPDAFTCSVEQGHYDHAARKATWLYVKGVRAGMLPALKWGSSGQRLDPVYVARHGYERARRAGIMGAVGGKDKQQKRATTPAAFRELLLDIACLVGL